MQENKDRLYAFHQEILQDYIQIMSGDRNIFFRMKELWFYLGDPLRIRQIPKKDQKVRADRPLYQSVVDALFREQELR